MALHGHQERRREYNGPEDNGRARPIRPSRFAMEIQLAEHCISLINGMFLVCSNIGC
jgi:hypothetical protein